MGFRRFRSPRIAMLLVVGCAVASTYVFQSGIWGRCGLWYEELPGQYAERYRLLGDAVPAGASMRFVVDERHATNRIMSADSRLYLAQLALSPRVVGNRVESRWVIVDSDVPEAIPKVATRGGWDLVADLHNGVRLYRTDARK